MRLLTILQSENSKESHSYSYFRARPMISSRYRLSLPLVCRQQSTTSAAEPVSNEVAVNKAGTTDVNVPADKFSIYVVTTTEGTINPKHIQLHIISINWRKKKRMRLTILQSENSKESHSYSYFRALDQWYPAGTDCHCLWSAGSSQQPARWTSQ